MAKKLMLWNTEKGHPSQPGAGGGELAKAFQRKGFLGWIWRRKRSQLREAHGRKKVIHIEGIVSQRSRIKREHSALRNYWAWWVWLEQAERWDWGSKQGLCAEVPWEQWEGVWISLWVWWASAGGLWAGRWQDLIGALFGSVWLLCGEWGVREQEWKWGYHNVALAQDGRTKGDRFRVCFSGRADSTSWWIQSRGRKGGRSQVRSIGLQNLGFLSLPKEAEVEGFLQSDLRSGASEPTRIWMRSCCHWATGTGESVYWFIQMNTVYAPYHMPSTV